MWSDIPAMFHDLIDMAAFIYAADQTVKRGGNGIENFGGDWRRKLFFRVPVREPDFWNQHDVQRDLVETLSFLSDDQYLFEFVQLENIPPLQRMFEFFEGPWTGMIDEVVLFSGGLDSLAGAVQESVLDRRRVLLVNHRSTEKLTRRHQHLVNQLNDISGDTKPVHIPVHVNKAKNLGREHTQRSRSFLFAALGATFASMLGLNRLRFYENGVISLNLPVSGQVVGARATRTTHPRVLRGLESLLSRMSGRTFTVENRFLWKTKTDVLRLIGDAGCSDLIRYSTSCTHTWEMTKAHTHCGTCSQCIDRRFAVLAADLGEQDPGEAYKVDLLTGERASGDPRTMLAAYVETANEVEGMNAETFFSTYGEAYRVLRHVDGTPNAVAMEIFSLEPVRKPLEQPLSSTFEKAISSFRISSIQKACQTGDRCHRQVSRGECENDPQTPAPLELSAASGFRRL